MPRQIDTDEVKISQMRRQRQEAGTVVEPAVQGNQQGFALLSLIRELILKQGHLPTICQGEQTFVQSAFDALDHGKP